jgi:hypothetical protein
MVETGGLGKLTVDFRLSEDTNNLPTGRITLK